MIFRTMPSSIDKSRTALALFNKDWNIFKSNWQNASGGFKNKFVTLFNSNDINCLKEYNRQIQAGIKPSIAYKNCMMNCTKEAKQNAVAMAKGVKSYEQASTSIRGMTISAKAGRIALQALSTAGNILAFMAITKVVSSVISVVDEMANSTKKLKESASELGENLSDTVSSIDDYKKKIEDLYNTINNSSSSIKDVTQARTDLMVVQDELIEKFGTEKNAIENITNAVNGQIGALDNLSKKSYYETKNKFNEKTTGDKVKDWLTFGNTDDNRVQSNMDKMVAQMTSGLYELETTGNEVLDNLIAKSYDLNIYSDIYGDGKHFLISGELDEIQEKLYGIQELSKDFDVSTGFENNFTEISNDVDSLLESYQDLYDQYVLYEKILTNNPDNKYDEQFNLINQAKDAYVKTLKSGDSDAIQKASDNYAQTLSSAIDLAMSNYDYDVADYFEGMYPEMQQMFGEWRFSLNFEPNTNGIKDKVTDSLDGLEGFSSQDILNFNPNVATEEQVSAYGELNNVAEQYGLTLQQLINLLIQMGLVQSESYQNLVAKFGQDNVNKIAPEDLEIAYSISSEEADKALEQEKNKIKSELQSLSKEGNVDLTIRPVIDSSAMQDAGWDVEDGSIATTFTQGEFIWQGDEENGQYVYIHYTPILPDGTVLTPDELTDYLYGTLEGSQSVLDADNKGIVLKVDTDLNIPDDDIKKFTNGEGSTDAIDGLIQKTGEWDDKVHGVQEQYYDTGEGIGYASNALDGLIEKHKQLENGNGITDLFINTLNSADYAEIKDELLELAKSGELTPETLSSTEEYANLLKSTDTSAESAMNQILDLLTAQEKLAGFSQGLDKLKSAYEEFKDEDIGFVTAETLQSLPDSFKKLPEFDLFSQIVGDPTSGAGAIQQAFNDIVKAYMLSQDVLQGLVNASEHDIQSYIANFKQMGVTNAEEVVNLAVEALNSENKLLNSAEAEYIDYLNNKDDYDTDYLESVASKNGQLASALGEAYKADYDNWCELLHDKAEAYNQFIKALEESGIVYDSSKSIQENAQNAIKKEGYSPSEIDRINRAASNAELSSYLADKQKQALKLDLSQITTDFGTKYSPSTGSDGSSDSNKPSEVTQEFNWIEKYLESFARRTEKIMNRISDYLSFKKNLSTIKSAVKAIRTELSANQQALAEYEKQMNAVGLSQIYIDKIKNGELNIETITGYETDGNKDANAQLIEKIEKYQDLYDKYTDIEDTIEDLRETEREWLVKNLEYINEYYQKLADIKNIAIDKKQDNIDLKEAQGKKVTTSDYNKLVSNNEAYIKSLRTTYKKTNAEFNKLVNNGTIEKNSAEWFEWKETLADLNSEIVQAKINTAEWKGEINQIKIDGYTNSLDRLKAKHDKLNDAISKKKSSGVVVSQSDYNKVINNLNQQITKNEKLLALYKNLQSGTEKGSAKWLEYQELIEGTETEIASLGNSIIEEQEAINQLKIDKITSSLDRLEAKNEELNDAISEREALGLDVREKDYSAVIKNNDSQIRQLEKQNALLYEYQSQVEKGSDRWKEFQEQIDSNNSSIRKLNQSTTELIKNIANIPIEERDEDLENSDNTLSLLQKKYDNATSAKERKGILKQMEAEQKRQKEIYEKAKKESQSNLSKSQDDLLLYRGEQTARVKKSKAEVKENKKDVSIRQKEFDALDKQETSLNKKISAIDETIKNTKDKTLLKQLKEQKKNYEKQLKDVQAKKDKAALELDESKKRLAKSEKELETAKKNVSALSGYKEGEKIDTDGITDKDTLEKIEAYNSALDACEQATYDCAVADEEYTNQMRENSQKRLDNIKEEYEALIDLNNSYSDSTNALIDMREVQGYDIADGLYESIISNSQKNVELAYEEWQKHSQQMAENDYTNDPEGYQKAFAENNRLQQAWYDSIKTAEEYLDAIMDKRIESLEEEKEKLQELHDLQERRYKLEEAKYNLEKAKQKTNLVYNGTEFVYQADTNAVKEAEKSLDDVEYDELINKIEDWIKTIEDAKKNINLYDADGNPLGSTEDIIKAAREFGDNLLDGFEKLLKLNKLTFNEEGGVVGKSDDAKSLGEDNLVAFKDGEIVLQSNELYKKLVGIVGTGTVPTPILDSPILDLKPVIPDNLVRVNTAPNIEVNLVGDMQFNEVQNVSDLSKAIVNGQLRGAIKQGLGMLKM